MNVHQKIRSRPERGSRQRVRPWLAPLIVSALTLTISACSSSGSQSTAAATTAVASASTVPSAAGGEGSHVTVWTLSLANKAAVGAYLVAESTTGQDALTVYVFNKDVPGSGTSACDATCTTTWPPLLLTDGATVRVSGITGKLAQLARSDGAVQVTYNGAPLYFYVNDHSAGDTNGVSVSTSWSPATP